MINYARRTIKNYKLFQKLSLANFLEGKKIESDQISIKTPAYQEICVLKKITSQKLLKILLLLHDDILDFFVKMGPDLSIYHFWPSVNRGPTQLWPRYFLFDPTRSLHSLTDINHWCRSVLNSSIIGIHTCLKSNSGRCHEKSQTVPPYMA